MNILKQIRVRMSSDSNHVVNSITLYDMQQDHVTFVHAESRPKLTAIFNLAILTGDYEIYENCIVVWFYVDEQDNFLKFMH